MYGPEILSKIIDTGDTAAIKRLSLDAAHFPTQPERAALEFIDSFAQQNGGSTPSGQTVATECAGFQYVPGVTESFDFLAQGLKDAAAKRNVVALFESGRPENWLNEKSAKETIDLLTAELDRIKMRTNVRNKVGTSVKTDVDDFRAEYDRRQRGESFRVWQSTFPTVNRETGGYTSGNVYAWYGRTGRGKSVLTAEEGVESALQGATVLIWSMEMPRYEVLARLYTSLSRRAGLSVKRIDGVEQEIGFANRDLRMATLTDDDRAELDDFLRQLCEALDGDIIIRAVDDDDFYSRTVRDLETDIELTGADVVVIDPIYYMDFERNTSKTKGGDIAATSKALRRLAGKMQTVIHVITQADEVAEETDAEGERELRPPTRKELSKSKAILQDAALTIGIDTLDNRGIVQLNKGRDGGEGTRAEIVYMPGYGIVREMPTGDVVAKYFDF